MAQRGGWNFLPWSVGSQIVCSNPTPPTKANLFGARGLGFRGGGRWLGDGPPRTGSVPRPETAVRGVFGREWPREKCREEMTHRKGQNGPQRKIIDKKVISNLREKKTR